MIEKLVEFFVWLVGGLPLIGSEPAASVQAYSAAVQTILTFILAPITVFAAWMARNAWIAARHQREDALMPLLTVTIDPDNEGEDTVTGPNFSILNVGVGPALNVESEIVVPRQANVKYLRDQAPSDEPQSMLIPAGKSRTVYFSEERLQAAYREHRTWRNSSHETPPPAKAKGDLDHRRFAAVAGMEPHVVASTFRLTYCDVYRRRFLVTVPLRLSDEKDRFGARRIVLGEATYSGPR